MPRLGKWKKASLRRVGSLLMLAPKNYAILRTSRAPMASTTWCADIPQNAIALVARPQSTISSIMVDEQKMLVQNIEPIII